MKKILIVDDEPNNRLLLEEMLEDFAAGGHQLLFAEDGEAALQLIRAEKPDLVLLDVMLPQMDGFAVCRAVKQQPGLEQVFMVILTAKSQEADRQKALAAKADRYITKPFKARMIIDLANQVLRTNL